MFRFNRATPLLLGPVVLLVASSMRLDALLRQYDRQSATTAPALALLLALQTTMSDGGAYSQSRFGSLKERANNQAEQPGKRRPGGAGVERQQVDEQQEDQQTKDLLELLAQFYAHTVELGHQYSLRHQSRVGPIKSKQQANKIDNQTTSVAGGRGPSRIMFGAEEEESLLKWLKLRQRHFSSLKNTTFELLSEPPNKTINVCSDGPKILVLPNVSDILYCYSREQWIDKLWSDLHLSAFHYPIIVLNILIFLFGTTGNIFVCLSVYQNHQLRSVTNYFIVNLAFADFLVILICLPATVVWDLSLTWFFGTIPCKLIMFLQDVSISVSVLTLTAISIDRYYAICHPFRFKSSLSQAKRVIVVIWIVSLIIMAPDLIYLSAKESQELSEAGLDTVLYSDCNYDLSERSSKSFQFVKTVILYLVPFVLMFCAHYKIMRTLRDAGSVSQAHDKTIGRPEEPNQSCSSRPGGQSRRHRPSGSYQKDLQANELQLLSSSQPAVEPLNRLVETQLAESAPNSASLFGQQVEGSRQIRFDGAHKPTQCQRLTKSLSEEVGDDYSSLGAEHLDELNDKLPPRPPRFPSERSMSKQTTRSSQQSSCQILVTVHNKSQLESRRTAAKMLTAIVVLFGICYLPVHLINFLRQFIENIPQTDVTSTISMLAHCVCYLNSAINPIIYNYMNSVFRDEFKKFLSCLSGRESAPRQEMPSSRTQQWVIADSSVGQPRKQSQPDSRNGTGLKPLVKLTDKVRQAEPVANQVVVSSSSSLSGPSSP